MITDNYDLIGDIHGHADKLTFRAEDFIRLRSGEALVHEVGGTAVL